MSNFSEISKKYENDSVVRKLASELHKDRTMRRASMWVLVPCLALSLFLMETLSQAQQSKPADKDASDLTQEKRVIEIWCPQGQQPIPVDIFLSAYRTSKDELETLNTGWKNHLRDGIEKDPSGFAMAWIGVNSTLDNMKDLNKAWNKCQKVNASAKQKEEYAALVKTVGAIEKEFKKDGDKKK